MDKTMHFKFGTITERTKANDVSDTLLPREFPGSSAGRGNPNRFRYFFYLKKESSELER